MPLIVREATVNTTPDATQGGLAVTTPSNTGHGSSQVDGNGGSQTKTCIWTAFPATAGQVTSVVLKFDWSESGSPGDGSNEFRVEYSTNGGGAWTAVFAHAVNGTTSSNSTVALTLPVDTGQFQLRDKLFASSFGAPAQLVASISNIKVEVTTVAQAPIVMW